MEMKKLAITKVCEAMDECIAEVKAAIERAKVLYPNDRSYARNLEYKVDLPGDYNQLLRQLRHEEEYLSQPKFEKCFDESETA
jgi:hypothetical protein